MNTIKPIESPGTTLSLQAQQALLERLLPTTRSAFGTPITEDDVCNHLFDADRTYLLEHDGALVGFSSYKHLHTEHGAVLYLSGIAIDRSAHGKGLFRCVNEHALASYDPDYLVMRTQNPVIYRGVERLVDMICPARCPSPERVLDIARRFAGKEMEPDTHVVRGLYGTSLYDVIPADLPTRDFFDECLRMDYARGDSVVIVGVLKKPAKTAEVHVR